MNNYDKIKKLQKGNEQYLKDLSEWPLSSTIKVKHFNNLEEGELPWVAKWFLLNLKNMYDAKLLTKKPLEVKAYIKKYSEDDIEPKLVIDYILG